MDIAKTLAGKKTYIAAALGAAVVFLQAAEIITVEQAAQIGALLAAFGFATMRAGIAKAEK